MLAIIVSRMPTWFDTAIIVSVGCLLGLVLLAIIVSVGWIGHARQVTCLVEYIFS